MKSNRAKSTAAPRKRVAASRRSSSHTPVSPPASRRSTSRRSSAPSSAVPKPLPPASDLTGQLLEAWRTNQRINVRLLEQIDDAGLRCTLSHRGGRSVGRQLAHLHYVRIYHLQKRARALAAGARIFATSEEPDRRELQAALEDSSRRIEEFIRRVGAGAPGVRTLKRGLVQHVAYFVAHESHHRGNILLTLKQSGHAVDSATRYAVWDWDRI